MAEHTTTHAEALEIIAVYTANIAAANPGMSAEAVNLAVAAAFTKYLAAAVDPGAYAYYPHPYTPAEAILHNAAAHLFEAAAAAEAETVSVTPMVTYSVPAEALTDFAAFSAFLDSIPVGA